MSVVDTSASTSAMAVPTLTSQILAGRRATIASRRPVNARPTRLTSTRGPAAPGRPLDARDRLPQARPINPEPAAASVAAATSRNLPSPAADHQQCCLHLGNPTPQRDRWPP